MNASDALAVAHGLHPSEAVGHALHLCHKHVGRVDGSLRWSTTACSAESVHRQIESCQKE